MEIHSVIVSLGNLIRKRTSFEVLTSKDVSPILSIVALKVTKVHLFTYNQ